jgi:hypothetical protein
VEKEMAHMSNETRQSIIEVAKSNGFPVQLKSDGTDLYDKNLVFRSLAYGKSPIFIHKQTGMSPASGEFNFLKVAIKPEAFDAALVNPALGIGESINRQSKINRHHSSNYVGFPTGVPGKREPYGKCYEVQSLSALSELLAGLTRVIRPPRP